MTYQNLKTKVVEEKKEMTSKKFNGFLVRYSLMLITLMLEFILVVNAIVNSYVAFVTAFIFIFAFIWVLDWCGEDSKVLNVLNKLSHIWFVNILLIIGTFILLKVMHFL